MPSTKIKKNQPSEDAPAGRTAATADKYELYELSVQEPEAEIDLIDQIWREQHHRKCHLIREDFCGTAAVCREWVKRRKKNRAIGVDLDTEVLAWAQARMAKDLETEDRDRIQILQQDVRTVQTEAVDSVLAMNFSYYLFDTRSALRSYFEHVRASLVDDGIFLLDAYGGSDSFLELEEDRNLDGFTYTWEQARYNPITGRAVNYIHFHFPDDTKMNKAFVYKWRLWTLPEIRELLDEAGFSKSVVYWEGTDEETDEGDGEWTESVHGEACPGWVAYIAGIK